MANHEKYPPVVLVDWNSKLRVKFMRETNNRYKEAGLKKPRFEYTHEPVTTQHDPSAAANNVSSQAVDTAQHVGDDDDDDDDDDDNDLVSKSESLLASFQPSKDRRSDLATSSKSASPMLKRPVVSTAAIQHDGDAAALREQWASELARETELSSADGPLRKKQKLGSRKSSTSGSDIAHQQPEPIDSTMKKTKKEFTSTAISNKTPNTRLPQQPAWYSAMGNPKIRGNYSSIIDNLFGELKSAIKNCEVAAQQGQPLPEALLKTITNNIHKAFFAKFDSDKDARMAIRKNRLLHNETGLPRLFSAKWLSDLGFQTDKPGHTYPFYIVADAKELYTKWWMGSFDTNLYRGIILGTMKNLKLGRPATANRLDPSYAGRIEGKFFGNAHLMNGQWWPHQICALRDGAHNSAQGGIAGNIADGAWSVIVAGGNYEDVDKGEVIEYCGTEGTADHTTDVTRCLLQNVQNGRAIRVIRSERCKNPVYAPARGYRYDGLYNAVSAKMIKPETSHHIFKLVRMEGQDPIRYRGEERRPTLEEVAEFNKEQAEREFRAPAEQGKARKKAF